MARARVQVDLLGREAEPRADTEGRVVYRQRSNARNSRDNVVDLVKQGLKRGRVTEAPKIPK